MLKNLEREMRALKNPKKAQFLQGFFKTGKGQYAENDVFWGITVPDSRKVAKKYKDLSFTDTKKLLQSPIHEKRLVALLILVHNFEKGDEGARGKIFNFYLRNTKHINNWDLVDLSAHKIVGAYIYEQPKRERLILKRLAKSRNLWERRIAIISTFWLIHQNDFKSTLEIARILLHDEHDLIHKAVGWMLREVGKRDLETEETFLRKHYKAMPRTMLRYAIERFPESKRGAYLRSSV